MVIVPPALYNRAFSLKKGLPHSKALHEKAKVEYLRVLSVLYERADCGGSVMESVTAE